MLQRRWVRHCSSTHAWCSYCNDDRSLKSETGVPTATMIGGSLKFEGGVLQIFNGGGWLVGYGCSCFSLGMGM